MRRTWVAHVVLLLSLFNPLTAVSVAPQSLVGCGAITRPSRIYPYSPANYDFANNMPGTCMQACSAAGYAYASVSGGRLCFCGSSSANIALLNTTSTTLCQVNPCTGDATVYCGDTDYELVYTSIGVIDSASIVLNGGGSALALSINQVYQFNLAYQGAVNVISYQVDFGDGTMTGWFAGTLNTTTSISNAFSRAGEFAITVATRSVVGMQPIMTAIVVKVSDQISALDLSIVCPNVTVTKKTVSCVLTSVRGTDLTGQFTYNTTNGSHLISSIPDAQYATYGSRSVTFYPTVDASVSLQSVSDVVILPQSTVTMAGQIASIQLFASAPGSMTIYLLRRVCTTPAIYCYSTNMCGACGSPYTLQCSSSVYSTISGACVNASAAQRVQQSVYASTPFQIIAQWAYASTGPGYVQITVNGTSPMTNRTAMVGDILGFKGAFIAKEISTDGTADYRCTSPSIVSNAFTCAVASLSANGTNYRHLLQTTIVQAIQIAPIMSYDNVGNFNVQGTLTQRMLTSFSTSTILPVIYGIDWIEVVGPVTVSVSVIVTFTANVYPPNATATIFLWTLNGNSYVNSTSNTLNISFPAIGTNTIGCQAQNLLSMKTNSTSILVQDIITNLTLHAGNITNVSTSQPLEVARFRLQMASGSNYVCRVNYDTSQTTTQIYFYTYGYIPGSYFTHQYLQPGTYNVQIRCENSASNVSYSFVHYVQYPIVGLQLQQHGTIKNSNYRLNFTIAQGSLPQFRILVNGTLANYTYYSQYNLVQTNAFNGQPSAFNMSVEIYAWNQLSSSYLLDSFSVLSPIVNPQVQSSAVNASFPGPILFEYTMESGSDVQITFSFDDTLIDNPVVCQYRGDYPTNQWSRCAGTNHTFQIPGTITVIVAFSNAISTVYKYVSVTLTTSVQPIEVRTDLQLMSQRCSAAFIDNRGVASFMIQSKNISSKPASNARVMIIPDAVNQPSVSQGPFQLNLDYFASPAVTSSGLNVIYTSPGTYTAIFQVSNSIDAANISCVVQVVPVLQQVYYSLNPPNWPLTSATPFQASVFIGDPNPGLVTITWDFGDGTVLSGPRTATQYYQADTRSHSYSAVGTYTLTITVQGPTNIVVNSFPVQVQYPVRSFNVTTPSVVGLSSQIAYTGSPITVTFNVQDTSSPPASSALLLVDYNDTSPLSTNSVINVSLPFTGTYTFISPGVFLVNMTVYNRVSTSTQIIRIGVNAPFSNYDFTLCYLLPGLTDPLSDTCGLTPTGGRYYLPKQSQVVLYVRWSNPSGVAESFDVQFRSGFTIVFTQTLTLCQVTNVSQLVGTTAGEPLFRLVVNLENNPLLTDGTYTVSVNTHNPSFSASYSLNVYIVSIVAGLSIGDGNILLPMNAPKTFLVTYEYFSPLSCLYIKYSDNAIDCFGDSTTCMTLPSDRPSLASCPSPVQAYTYSNSTVVFTRAFNTSRAWFYGYAWNSVTRASASTFFPFPLGTANCGLPSIEFTMFSPIISGARRVPRSSAFSVAARTALACAQSLNNTKRWTILACDTTTERCVATVALNQLIARLPSATTSEIFLAARALPMGTYLFNHTVTMNSLNGFATSDYTYVTIISSDIQVNLLANGTSMITSGVTQSLLFQPGVYSVDPDSSFFNPQEWSFDYYCRLYGQASYPRFNGMELTIESPMIDRANPSCFDTPGNSSYYKYGPNNNRSILYVQPRALPTDRFYEFKVVLTNLVDTTRQYTGFAVVQTQEIDSVLVATECIIQMCSPNVEYQRINPTTQALLTSHCLQTCDDASEIVIQWTIYRGFQTGYPNNDVFWILYTNMSGGDDLLFFGRQTQNFTATSALFQSNPSVTHWKFQATYVVTNSKGVTSGTGAVRFQINSPPINGTCTIDRTTGTTATLFQLSCINWYDVDGIKDYTFYAKPSVSASRIPIGFTKLNNFELYLPIGDPNANYALQLTAEIRDTYGAVSTFSIGTVTVTPDNATLMSFIQIAQQAATQGRSSNPIEQTLYGGDQNLVSQTILSLAQVLSSMTQVSQQNAATGEIPRQNIQVAGLTGSSSVYPTTNTSANTSLAMSAYLAQLNTNAIVRDYAIQFLNNLTVTTIDSVKLQAAAIAELTSVPTELTRQAVTFGAQKCDDLVNALNGMVQSVSYEDVQIAVNSIAGLASNVLVAMNAPLLGRGGVINLDYDRANTLPPDYETDLETPWSNPNLFADGDDFSVTTLERNRNMYYQQQGSNQLINQVENALSKAVNALSCHMNTGQTNTIDTPAISMVTKKLEMNNLSSLVINAASGAQIRLPAMSYCNITTQIRSCVDSTPITINSIVLPLPTAGYNGRSQVHVNMSRSISLNLLSSTGSSISLNNMPSPIAITIPRDSNLLLPAMTLQNVTGTAMSTVGANNNRQFSLYYVNVTSPNENITVSATFELQSDNSTLGYMIIFRFDAIPVLNSSMNNIDGSKVLCPADRILTTSNGYIYSYILDNTRTVRRQYAMFGIRELSASELAAYCANNGSLSNSTAPITDRTANFTANYYIRAYTSGCFYLDRNMYWRSLGVTVGSQTNHAQTECFTNHLTTFAGGWIVLPAPVNWNYVFANADFARNKTIYLTIILLIVFYIIFMIYARFKDRKDVEKLGVTPLPDNLTNDKYYYQIIVFTGLRKDAGTSSKVFFIVAGDDDETGTRTFEDPERKILRRGGIDSFIMAVPKSLGRLNYMRVWHDNSGSGASASWFLKYIVVRDLQTMEKNHFICQKWLGVEKDDGVVDRLLPVAGELQKTEFAYLLSKKTYHSMSDGHLWFSVFSRPPSTRFTRTQRCTCCFVLLFMSMLLNIMYYDQSKEAQSRTAGGIAIGPLFVTPEQIGIGVIVELICFLPSTILVEMFRRLRLRRRPKSPVREALKRMQDDQKNKQHQAALNDIHPHLTNFIVNSDPVLSNHELDAMRNTLASPLPNKTSPYRVTKANPTLKKKKGKRTLPWWFVFIAYGFSFLVFGVSALFIIARGIEFGDTKTQKWLVSSIAGFFSSILLTQPLKVVCMAVFFAMMVRRDDDEEIIDNDDEDIFLDSDEEYLHNMRDGSLLTFRSKSGHIPLTQGEVAFARDRRLKQIRMWEIIRELLAYASFLWILYVVSYSNRDPNAYYLMKHLKHDLLNLNNATNDFTQIYRTDQYWDWLTNSFAPDIRATNWYNGDKATNLSGYVGDKTNRILGWATMRQLRVKPDSCKILASFQNIITGCEAGYNLFNEDRRSFYPGWSAEFNTTLGPMANYSKAISNAFTYRESDTLDTYTYVGEHATYGAGGYVFEFRGGMSEMLSNISALRQLSWLDMQTRAVIIQLSLYNPNVNLFVFVTILVEFIPTGALYPSARVEPISLMNEFDGFALFKLICSILYMVFIVYYMQREIRSIFRHRMAYFREFWSYPELGIIACSWGGLGVYVWRIREGDRVGDLFKQTDGYAYVNLQLAAYVSDVLTFLLGFCCFFGTIKFLRLLRFNHRMSLLSSTLSYAAKDLFSFTCMFSIIYLGYLALFFLLFHSKIWACSDAIKTAQMLFEMMLLKFDVSDLYAADIFLGPFCFTMFVIFVVFICMNMFISIIADSFRVVRHNVSLQHSEHEIVGFMFNQFKKLTGLGRPQEMDQLHLNPYDGTRVQYHDPVTSFPDKMDELILALNKIYMDTKRNDTVMFRPAANEKSENEGKSSRNNHQ